MDCVCVGGKLCIHKTHCLCLTMLCGLFVLQGQGTRMFWKLRPRTLSLVNKQAKEKTSNYQLPLKAHTRLCYS